MIIMVLYSLCFPSSTLRTIVLLLLVRFYVQISFDQHAQHCLIFFRWTLGALHWKWHLLSCGKRNIDLNFIVNTGVKCQKVLPNRTWIQNLVQLPGTCLLVWKMSPKHINILKIVTIQTENIVHYVGCDCDEKLTIVFVSHSCLKGFEKSNRYSYRH